MKRAKYFLITIILMAGFALLTACGGGNNNDTRDTQDPRDTPAPIETPAPPGPTEAEARTMSVFRVDGASIQLTRAGGQSTNATAGQRLHEGYSMITEAASFGYVLLDRASLVKLDENSRIYIDRATDRLLSIVLEHGQILVDVQEQAVGHTLYTRVGNVGLGVRGTLYIIAVDGDTVVVIMLEGSVETDDGRTLHQGTVTTITDGVERIYDERPLVLEELDTFALQAIWDYWYRVQDAGITTADMLDTVRDLLGLPATAMPGAGGDVGSIDDPTTDPTAAWEPPPPFGTHINLADGGFTDEQLAYMVESGIIPAYATHIWMSSNYISDLTPLSGLANLEFLVLAENNISDLTPLYGLTNLTGVFLSANPLTYEAVDSLRAALPNCEVHFIADAVIVRPGTEPTPGNQLPAPINLRFVSEAPGTQRTQRNFPTEGLAEVHWDLPAGVEHELFSFELVNANGVNVEGADFGGIPTTARRISVDELALQLYNITQSGTYFIRVRAIYNSGFDSPDDSEWVDLPITFAWADPIEVTRARREHCRLHPEFARSVLYGSFPAGHYIAYHRLVGYRLFPTSFFTHPAQSNIMPNFPISTFPGSVLSLQRYIFSYTTHTLDMVITRRQSPLITQDIIPCLCP